MCKQAIAMKQVLEFKSNSQIKPELIHKNSMFLISEDSGKTISIYIYIYIYMYKLFRQSLQIRHMFAKGYRKGQCENQKKKNR